MPNDGKDALLGRTIAGKFAIESFIGQGAMGAVYKAKQLALDKVVAIKVMHRTQRSGFGGTPPTTGPQGREPLSGDEMFAARFLREAKAASRIDHPSSLRVIDFGEEPDGLLYMAMEYLDGRDLYTLLQKDFPLAPARIVDIMMQALAAVAVAHEMGVVHRDLKPENIMVLASTDDEGNPKDLVKVCDFGIAKITARQTEVGTESGLGPKLTTAGLVVGTPEYMSPEQGRGESLDARSDIYSMGVIMFQLLTGRVPFEAETALGVVLKHVTDAPPKPSSIVASTDPRLEAICLRAMQKKKEDRYQTAREMRAELKALAATSLAHVAVVSAPPPRVDRASLTSAATEVAFDSGALRMAEAAGTGTQSKLAPLGSELEDAGLPRRRWAGILISALLLGATTTVVVYKAKEGRGVAAEPPAASQAPVPSTLTSVAPVDDPDPTVAPLESAAPSKSHHHPKNTNRADGGADDPSSVSSADSPASSASAAPSASPAAGGVTGPTYDPSRAHVVISGITPRNTDNRSVRQILNLKEMSECYQKGLVGTKTRPPPVHEILKLETDETGHVTGVFLNGPTTPANTQSCMLQPLAGKIIGGSGQVGADVDLVFLPDDR